MATNDDPPRPQAFLGDVDAVSDMIGIDSVAELEADEIDDAALDIREAVDRVEGDAACDLEDVADRLEDIAERLRAD